MQESASFSAESYFATQPAPPSLAQDIAGVKEFVARQAAQNRNVVLVTSGGTTVPLELNVVRFLDNFSAGTRGATSAEYFLKAGYAVIFMHRQFSLQPFSRHYSHSTNPFLDFLAVDEDTVGITADKRADADLLTVLTAYKGVHAAGTLHTLTFVTVNDYLWLLRAVSPGALRFAAPRDVLSRRRCERLFLTPAEDGASSRHPSEHKIQSGKGSLHIEMDQVPKILKPMVEEWTRDGYIVSFKLETEERLLVPKARAALERYGHQVVIGNELHTRKWQVIFVERKRKPLPPLPPGAAEEQEQTEAGTSGAESNTDSEPALAQVTAKEGSDSLQEPEPAAPPAFTESPAAETEVVAEAGTAEVIPMVPVSDARSPSADANTLVEAPPPPPKSHTHSNDDEQESMTFVESWLRIPLVTPAAETTQVKEIEEDIVAELVRRHAVWIDSGGQ
ncbi:Phosphopantothenate--cysteine ligase CAB2 [Mycena venus]|uniref:Phosphopantothenate--cysteine ligase CAB2 n=1 Tax=Mycena venus TaxID=2733690 RepID=A0A8H6YJI7_9AGAR|nr:Phosphopantothenate--cysteine ligase CAB2 [Mycena venus]